MSVLLHHFSEYTDSLNFKSSYAISKRLTVGRGGGGGDGIRMMVEDEKLTHFDNLTPNNTVVSRLHNSIILSYASP